MRRVVDGDRADAATLLVGCMFLDMNVSLNRRSSLLQNGGYKVKNVGLVMALFIRFANEMRQCDFLRLQSELFNNSSRFDDYIREFAGAYSIKVETTRRRDLGDGV